MKSGMFAVALAFLSNCTAGSTADVNVSSTSSLVPVGQLRVARHGHTGTLLPNGKVLIAGGASGSEFLASAELFDPSSRTFTQIANMTTRRAGHTATLLGNGTVLIIGGAERPDRNLASTEIFDPATGTFTPSGSMATARTDHSAPMLQDGRVLVVGGSEIWPQGLTSAEIYDPKTGKFTPTGSMNEPRRPAGVALLKSGEVLITGGSGNNKSVLAAAELYDPVKGVFTPIGRMTIRRHKHAASVLPDGSVLITGGSDETDWKGIYRSAEIFDPVAKKFRAVAGMNAPHFKHRSVELPDGRIVVAGGNKLVDIYDPKTGRFEVAAGDLGRDYYFPSATVLNNGNVLIAGGSEQGNAITNSAWILNTSR